MMWAGWRTPAGGQSADFDQGVSLFRQKQWEQAALHFAAAARSSPSAGDALLYLGKCQINLSRWREATVSLKSYAAAHPQSEEPVYLLGYIYFREDKPQQSLAQYTAAARLKAPNADDLKIVSLDYILLNDYTDAARYLELAVKMDPENLEARYHLGRVRYQQNRFDQAILAFEGVLKRDPNSVKAEDNLGLSLEAENKVEQATTAYRKAIALDGAASVHSEQPYLNLGILLNKSNQADQAVGLLLRAAEIDPKSAKTRYELGRSYLNLNRLAESRQQAEQAVQLNPQDAASHYLLARIYQRSGERDLARREFEATEKLTQAAQANSSGGMATGADRK